MDSNSSNSSQLALALYVAVTRDGSIGVFQEANCTATDIVKRESIHRFLINRKEIFPRANGSAARAQMLGVKQALILARGTIQHLSSTPTEEQKVTVYLESPEVAQTLTFHFKHTARIRYIRNGCDRLMVKNVIRSALDIADLGPKVSIASTGEKCKMEQARAAAGKAGCLERRHDRRPQRAPFNELHFNHPAEEQQEAAGEENPRGTFDLAIITERFDNLALEQ
ncbi:MAG: hypothetical protein M1820_008664 [Bogoriella megaspora]|nr:MAG: hypothetical protein M1820_008664 [Bogoriella megaspora]